MPLLIALLQAVDIRPQGEWGAPIENVQKVLDAAASELVRHSPDRKLAPILVEPTGGPITLFARGPNGEYQVRLATGGTLWSQYTYQFSHELAHILCGFDEDPHPQRWFEESLCETASLYVLRASAETWKTSPPYPNWKEYAPSLASYAEDRIKAAALPDETTTAAWYRENAAALQKDATDRARNTTMATRLLPLFEKEPGRWEAIAWLNVEKFDAETTFADYLGAWRRNCPEKHRATVEKIARILDVAVP